MYIYKDSLKSYIDQITGNSAREELKSAERQYASGWADRYLNSKYAPSEQTKYDNKSVLKAFKEGKIDMQTAALASSSLSKENHSKSAKLASDELRYETAKKNYDNTVAGKVENTAKKVSKKVDKSLTNVSAAYETAADRVTGRETKKAMDKAKQNYLKEVSLEKYDLDNKATKEMYKSNYDKLTYYYENRTLAGLSRKTIRKGAEWVVSRLS